MDSVGRIGEASHGMSQTERDEGVALLTVFLLVEGIAEIFRKNADDGERVVVGGWSKVWGGPIIDSTDYAQHFQLIYVREPVSVAAQELTDDRVAVIVPASWKEVAREEMRRYCATLRVEKEYATQQGPDAEEIRQTALAIRRSMALLN